MQLFPVAPVNFHTTITIVPLQQHDRLYRSMYDIYYVLRKIRYILYTRPYPEIWIHSSKEQNPLKFATKVQSTNQIAVKHCTRLQDVRGYCWTAVQRFDIQRVGYVERSNVLYVEDVMADYLAYVQIPIQSVPVEKLLGTKHVKLPPCVTRKTATLCYT